MMELNITILQINDSHIAALQQIGRQTFAETFAESNTGRLCAFSAELGCDWKRHARMRTSAMHCRCVATRQRAYGTRCCRGAYMVNQRGEDSSRLHYLPQLHTLLSMEQLLPSA